MSSQRRVTGYGVGAPSIRLNPPPIISNRAPTTSDLRYPLGQEWVYQISSTSADIYFLGTVAGGVATWVASGGGNTEVSTLTGDSGGSISPTGGNITLSGGALDTFVGSGSTLTLTPKAGGYPDTPYVVGPSGQAGYQTIQSAITALGANSGIIIIQPGTYTENLVFV